MKSAFKYLYILAILCICAPLQAQDPNDAYLEIPTRNQGFQLTIEGGKTNFVNTEKDYGYNGGHFYSTFGYKMNPQLSVGGGFGFDIVGMDYQDGIRSLRLNHATKKYEHRAMNINENLDIIKLYGRGQYRLNDKRFSPFVSCDLGLKFTVGGLRDLYGEALLLEESDRFMGEDMIAYTITPLLGKPSIVNVFATPAVGLSLRAANNSYLELKVGYTLSPYAMGVRKSTEYVHRNEQYTLTASCRPIKMSAPFVSLAFTHTFRVGSDLDESLYDATRARKRAERAEKWERALTITSIVLGAAATTVSTINTIQNRNNFSGDYSSDSGTVSSKSSSSSGTRKPSASSAQNESQLRSVYNGYHGQLADMKVYGRGSDSERIRIQQKMKSIRQELKDKYGTTISKSDLEDWNGN